MNKESKKTLWSFLISVFKLILGIGEKHVEKHVNN